jgi:tetratricopeptide (TPR) repeat protein
MMSSETPGQVITFYSYKGGTGRSMALANIACLLAQRQSLAEGKGVLVIDWDLEAPGLHRYFRDRFSYATMREHFEDFVRQTTSRARGGATLATLDQLPPLTSFDEHEPLLELYPGLIDLFVELDAATRAPNAATTEETDKEDRDPQDEEEARALIEKVDPERFILKTDVPSLHMMKAGCFDDGYAARVSMFQWEALYNRSPWLIRSLAEYLAEYYQYVIIDSRTGITDISGICTMLLPEKLVVVFTPNRQSLLGVQELVRRATKYRRQSDDLRPLAIFPLPSRIESSEPTLRDHWRLGDEREDIPGYQPLFEKLFEEIYDLSNCDLNNYFNEVQIQHAPSYSYGEKVAVLLEKSGGRLSLPQSYETVVDWIASRSVPWEQQQQQATATQDPSGEQIKLAEATYARLSAEQQEATRRLFTRLVRLSRPEEGGEDTRQRVKFSELSPAEQQVAEEWSKARLVAVQQDENNSDKTVETLSETLVREWKRLRAWLDEERDFLLWRQSLRADIIKWENAGRQANALLVGLALAEATQRRESRPAGALSEAEKSFIIESANHHLRREKKKRYAITAIAVFVFLVLLGSSLGYIRWRQQQRQEQQERQNAETAGNLLIKGQAYQDAGEYDSAIKAYDEAIKLKPNFPEAFYNRGRAYENKNDPGRAIGDYYQAINLKADYGEAYLRRGIVYYNQGSPDRAMSDYNRAIELLPNNAEAYYQRGLVQVVGKNLPAAIKDFSQSLTLKPDYYAALYERGRAYRDSGDKESAISDLKLVYQQEIEPAFSRYAGQLLRELGVDLSKPTSVEPPVGSRLGYCNNNNVFVRTAPDLNASPIAKMVLGQKLWVIGKSSNYSTWNGVSSNWTQVQLYDSSVRGWVFSPFVSY